jgi:hypothetical protein
MTDTRRNGEPADLEEELSQLALREAARIGNQAKIVHETEAPPTIPFTQHEHDLLLKTIDQVAGNWVDELKHVRLNSEQVEQLVLERAAKVKADLTMLFLLGNAVRAEAQRGEEVNAKLAGELEKLTEERAA